MKSASSGDKTLKSFCDISNNTSPDCQIKSSEFRVSNQNSDETNKHLENVDDADEELV